MKDYQNKQFLYNQYWNEGKSLREIAELCNVKEKIIWNQFNKLNIPRRNRSQGALYHLGTSEKEYLNKDWLYDQYWNRKKTQEEIGKICGVSKRTISIWMQKFDIKKRTPSENQTGKIPSIEIRKKISESSKKRWNKNLREKYSKRFKELWQTEEYRKLMKEREILMGERSPNWKGDNATPTAIHKYIQKRKTKPKICEDCNQEKRLGLSFLHHPEPYTRNIEDYRYLCWSCHMRYDYKIGYRTFLPKKKTRWYDNITKENAIHHLEQVKESKHIRTYYRHKEKLKELGLI